MRRLYACRDIFSKMKKTLKLTIVVLVLLIAVAAIWYLKFSGVTHKDIYNAVVDESDKVQSIVDDRYQKLDKKLDRVESKLDLLLEIANRPLPDEMRRVN